MTPVEHAKWCISGSNSDSDDEPVLGKIKLGQCDPVKPETVPKPEPCDVVQPAEVAAEPEAPPECIVPPPARKFLRRHRRQRAAQQ